MARSGIRPLLVALSLAALLLFRPGAPVGLAAHCEGNLLQNSDFEGNFPDRGGGLLEVAEHWNPWFDTDPGVDGYNFRPEYHASLVTQDSRRVQSGSRAQHLYTIFATHTAGLFQRVAATPGTTYRFSIYAQVWSSNLDDASTSAEDGDYQVRVGISTTGTDKFWEVDVWTSKVRPYDSWVQLEVTATATADAISVWTWGGQVHRVKHNDGYWDHACLQPLSTPTPVPTPTPPPTDTPIPTDTPAATATPAVTETPTLEATATPAETPGGTPTPVPQAAAATPTPVAEEVTVLLSFDTPTPVSPRPQAAPPEPEPTAAAEPPPRSASLVSLSLSVVGIASGVAGLGLLLLQLRRRGGG